jgi:glycyl-tRNA synthetase beta chain
MSNLLMDIFSEELPAKMQLNSLQKLTSLWLQEMPNSKITSFISPRHICISLDGINMIQTLDIKGPKVTADIDQLKGFMRKYHINKLEDLIVKNEVYFLNQELSLEESRNVIAKTITRILSKMIWPKSMYWSHYNLEWIRPIHSIACFLDDSPLQINFGHIISGTKTYCHRVHNSQEIQLYSANLNHYLTALDKGGVIISHQERKQMIIDQISTLLIPLKLNLIQDNDLLDEVVGMVEKPKVFIGQIDQAFMSLPHEILIASLKNNQKYLLVKDQSNNLAPYFIIVSDIDPIDKGQTIIKGNELVLKARLTDAQYMIKNDLQKQFITLTDKLRKILFHKDIGTIYEKVMRVQDIAGTIANQLGIEQINIRRAAILCKNDLVTEAVGEFPELQGIIGYYYAIANGEETVVAKAIKDHYKPSGPNDDLPETLEGCILAIADKIDTLNSLFAVNIKPTSTKDPYALRRAALGIIRMILQHQALIENIKLNSSIEVIDFISERAKHLYKDEELQTILKILKR